MKTRHTIGPWMISGTRWRPIAAVRAGNKKAVAHFSWMTANALGPTETAANARLIAAAPDLLEALVGCLEVLEDRPESGRNARDPVAKARAAIAKAVG